MNQNLSVNTQEAQVFTDNLLKHKKGRPMTDTNVIYDDLNERYYDPIQDPIEYKKARK